MSPQDPSLWIVLIIIGLLTFGIRLSFIEWLGAKKIPPVFTRTLRFVPLAVLTAIIFPEIFMSNGQMALTLTNTRMIAGVAAALVALRSKNVLLTIAVGMGIFWVLQAVMNAAN
jgi:branched-subunit amino acid transport protein